MPRSASGPSPARAMCAGPGMQVRRCATCMPSRSEAGRLRRAAGSRAGCRREVAAAHRVPGFTAEAAPSGDDLHCCRKVRGAMRSAGGNVLPTCRPGSHATSRECIHGARMDGLRGTGRAAGARWAPRHRMPDRLKIPAGHVVFNAWDRCLGTIAAGELPERPP